MPFHLRSRLDPHFVEALDGLRAEWRALRVRQARRRPPIQGCDYLQLGCGDRPLLGFVNSDFPPNPKADMFLDARSLLPFPDRTFKGAYAHHVVEHLDYHDARQLFSELHRVLKPGGIFRMIVPDLEKFLRAYASEDKRIFSLLPTWHMSAVANYVRTPLEMVDWMFRDSKYNRHLSSWDFTTAEARLRDAGFLQVTRREVNECGDSNLAGHDNVDWADHSLYVDAIN